MKKIKIKKGSIGKNGIELFPRFMIYYALRGKWFTIRIGWIKWYVSIQYDNTEKINFRNDF